MKGGNRMNKFLSIACIVSICLASNLVFAENTAKLQNTVVITNDNGKFVLLKNGRPFFIKGVCGYTLPKKMVQIGANSALVYDSSNLQAVLDDAQKYGIAITAFVPFNLERHGFSYNDPKFVQKQMESNKKLVNKFKNHPALLAWGVGNEVFLMSPGPNMPLVINTNNAHVWKAVNDMVKMIHSVDPNHPTFTTITEMNPKILGDIIQYCPDLDMLGINSYAGIISLPGSVAKSGWKKPVIVTEWGPNGHWEGGRTPWGAPSEPSSGEKYYNYEARYPIILSCTNLLGSYTFSGGASRKLLPPGTAYWINRAGPLKRWMFFNTTLPENIPQTGLLT